MTKGESVKHRSGERSSKVRDRRSLQATSSTSESGIKESNPERHLVEWIAQTLGKQSPGARALMVAAKESPGRISRAFREILSGYDQDPSRILKVTMPLPRMDYSGVVTAEDVPFLSVCAHHFLPFHGTVSVTYEPGSAILGIGKLPRLVICRARRFQLQETLVREVCEDLMLHGGAKGARVTCVAKHLCVCFRGVTQGETMTRVTYATGSLRESNR